MTNVVVLDYGVGNLFSICNAIKNQGSTPVLTSSPDVVKTADRLVVPGVGAFKSGMNALAERGLDEAVKEFVLTGKTVMGICLGMQMLLSESHEFGLHKGLDIIKGAVIPIPKENNDGKKHKIPNIGWRALSSHSGTTDDWHGTLLDGTSVGDKFYFVHSFYAQPENKNEILAVNDYNGLTLTAAVRKDNVYGFQFHPERSGPKGLDILSRFLNS